MIGLTLACAGVAVWLWVAPPDRVRRRLDPPVDATPWSARPWLRRVTLAVGSLTSVALLGALVGPAVAALAAAGLIGGGAMLRLWGLARRTRAEHATRAEVANACSVIANQVRVGRIPAEALALAAEDASVLSVASGVQRQGGDVAAALFRPS